MSALCDAWDEEHIDDGECCECGESSHACQDCPTFGGNGVTPGVDVEPDGSDCHLGTTRYV